MEPAACIRPWVAGRVAAVEAPDVRIQPSMHGPRYCAESTRMRYILYREGVSCVCVESACKSEEAGVVADSYFNNH